MGSAVHGEAAKRELKLTFYANKSLDGLQLGKYLANFGKWGTILIVTSCLTLSMPYFTSGGHFSDLLRCSKVQQLKVAIVTLRSDQQGDSNNSHFSQNSSTMARFKPIGKKRKGASKAKVPAKQGQDNWRSSHLVLAAAVADAAAAPVAAPTTNAVVPPAGSLGTGAPSGISTPSATSATTAFMAAATSSTAATDHSAAAAAPSSKKGVSKARAPAEGIAAASGVAVPLAYAVAGASGANMPDIAAATRSTAAAVPPPKKGSSKAKKPAKGTAVTSGIATPSAIAAAAISTATVSSSANANHSAPLTADAATAVTKPICQSFRAAAQTAKAVLW